VNQVLIRQRRESPRVAKWLVRERVVHIIRLCDVMALRQVLRRVQTRFSVKGSAPLPASRRQRHTRFTDQFQALCATGYQVTPDLHLMLCVRIVQ
jgi:hypothetical protein